MELYSDYAPVPEVFWSFETGEPFRRCSLCEGDLMIEGTNYLVEKAFKGTETIFEYALCLDCHAGLMESFSHQSRKLIEHYFAEHVDMEERRKSLISKHGPRAEPWMDHCMIKGTPVAQCEEHQIYGFFIDEDIVYSGMPYMLSGAVMDELIDLLSDETLGIIGDFSEKLFGIDQPQGFVVI